MKYLRSKNFFLLAIIIIILALLIGCGGDSPPPEDVADDVELEEVEGVLSAEDVEKIKANVEQEFEEEKELTGEEYRLHDIEYDADANQLNLTVDYQVDPILPAAELIDTNEAWVWGIVEANLGILEKDFDVRVNAVTKIGEDEFIHWGSTRYSAGEYTWREGSGMDMLE